MLFARGNEAIEGQGVFADMGVNQQRDFSVEFAQGREKRKGYLN